jgi:hypothetical protein
MAQMSRRVPPEATMRAYRPQAVAATIARLRIGNSNVMLLMKGGQRQVFFGLV